MRWTNCQIKFCESKTIIEGIHRKRVGFPRDECRSGKIWAENIGFPQVSLDTSRAYLKRQGSRKTNVEVGKYGLLPKKEVLRKQNDNRGHTAHIWWL